jgi:sugar lactone lactonase YvrE
VLPNLISVIVMYHILEPSNYPTFYPTSTSYPTSMVGRIATVAGNATGSYGFSGDGGQATSAMIDNAYGIACDTSGNIYIADTFNQRIRKLTVSTGIITTVAGNGSFGYGGDGGQATSAMLSYPFYVALDTSGNIYIADAYNYVIRKVSISTGVITTMAGNGTRGYSGDGGQATSAMMKDSFGVVVDTSGNVYISDSNNNRIRKVNVSTGVITTVAGTGTFGYSGDGKQATSALLHLPTAIAFDTFGNVYFSDQYNFRIRKVTISTGVITTVAGTGEYGYTGDGGQATATSLAGPSGIALDESGNIYIADSAIQRIFKVTNSTGVITSVAGTGEAGYSGDGGQATSAMLFYSSGIALDLSQNVYVADSSRIRKFSQEYISSRKFSSLDLTPNQCSFHYGYETFSKCL